MLLDFGVVEYPCNCVSPGLETFETANEGMCDEIRNKLKVYDTYNTTGEEANPDLVVVNIQQPGKIYSRVAKWRGH